MKILNVGCGATRPKSDELVQWTNIDNLHWQLPEDGAARQALDGEANYLEHDIANRLPFADSTFDGVLLSHVLEHFDAQQGLQLLCECKRVLNAQGEIVISVPDASYFRRVYPRDKNENWQELFEVTDVNNPIPTFFEAALWFDQHLAIMTEDSLWAYLKMAGFHDMHLLDKGIPWEGSSTEAMCKQLNRQIFSLDVSALKTKLP